MTYESQVLTDELRELLDIVADPPERVIHRPLRDAEIAAILRPHLGKVLKVKCVSCTRTIGFAWIHDSNWPLVTFQRTTRDKVGTARPQFRAERVDPERDYVEGGGLRLVCAPKCNGGKPRRYVFDARRAAEAFAVVAAAGRDELMLGLDL